MPALSVSANALNGTTVTNNINTKNKLINFFIKSPSK